MDDLFQIIIYILIAVSFLSQFFKKKKPVPPPEESERTESEIKDGNREIPSSLSQAREQPDFLKELESFFSVGSQVSIPPVKPPKPVHDDKEIYEGVENRVNFKKVPEDSFHKTTSSEHTFIDPWEQKQREIEKKKKAITPEIEKQAAKYQKELKTIGTSSAETAFDLKKKIKDPASLKEYIVISEIIGKPKSLRG